MKGNAITAENTPKQLGDFEILRELGRGGMGVVYEARQKSLNRRVALKVLSTGLGLTTKAVMRFKREAEAAAKLHHTNIVPIYSTGEENRVPYYAMELVDGPSLDQVLRELRGGTDSPSEGSLDSTHDLPDKQHSAVPDWVAGAIGLEAPVPDNESAASAAAGSESSSSFGSGSTYFDKVAGMMSEVADALAHAHDQGVIHRDIKPSNLLLSADGRLSINDFGLARMLEQPGMTISGELMGSPMYMSPEQIAVGRIPLDHRTDIYSLGAALYELITLRPPFEGRQRDQVLSQIIHKEPIPPRSINKRISKDLETICLKAMEKDPDRRYQTADLMAEDLRRFVKRHAISVRRIGPVERAARWARKNKSLTAMACLTVIISVSAAAFIHFSERKHLREQKTEMALTAAMSGNRPDAEKFLAEARKYGADATLSNIIMSQVHAFRGEVDLTLEELSIAVEQDPDNLMAQYMLATAYHMNGNAQEYNKKVHELASEPAINPRDKLFKGYAIHILDIGEGLRLMDEAIEELRDFDLAWLMRASARTLLAMDENHEDELLLALDEIKSVSLRLGEDNPMLSEKKVVARLAAYEFFRRKGETVRANSFLEEAAPDVAALSGSPHYLYGNISRMSYFDFISDLEEIERVMQEAIKHGNKGFIVVSYATACYRAGEYQRALNLFTRMPDQDDPFLVQSRAILLTETNGWDEAENICKESVSQGNRDALTLGCLFLLGKRDFAIQEASKLYDAMDQSRNWDLDRSLVGYLSGHIEEEEIESRVANSGRKQGDAYLIIGLRKLANGDRDGAKKSFEKSASSLVYVWSSVMWARAFAERMDKDTNWPDWLPPEPVAGKMK